MLFKRGDISVLLKNNLKSSMLSVMNLHEKEGSLQDTTTNYISNMMLPQKVHATRQQPLGPDCIISKTEVTDQAVLKLVHYYWCVSRDTGCVECVVKKPKSQEQNVITWDPKCIVTKKHRRFEAYCCMICRSNFVTIVQALFHLKAAHRPNSKILIQDKDVFDNLDKAMEVPPVPLPWHVAKKQEGKTNEEGNLVPTYVIPPGALTSSTIANIVSSKLSPNTTVPVSSQESKETYRDKSPMLCIIAALTRKFNKGIKHLKFKEDCSEADAVFEDGTTVMAKLPDLSNSKLLTSDQSADEPNEPLMFFVDDEESSQNGAEGPEHLVVTLLSNKPHLAMKMFTDSISVAAASSLPEKLNNSVARHELQVPSSNNETKNLKSRLSPVLENNSDHQKLKSTKKSVRFTLGCPDSDDDSNVATADRLGDSDVHDEEKQKSPKDVPIIKVSDAYGNAAGDKDASFEGLQTVIDDLISTASKGRILAPTSPVPSTSTENAPIPQVGSSPALLNMALPSSASSSSSLTRVQSWSPSVAPSPFNVAAMRRPYTARGYTYAERIQLMKQQNDYDAEFVTKHIRETDSRGAESKEEKAPEEESEVQGSTSMDSAAAMAVAYTTLLQRGLMTKNIFPSEYYGSGEWANAAIETIKSLKPILRSQEDVSLRLPFDHLTSQAYHRNATVQSEPGYHGENIRESLSDDNANAEKPPLLKPTIPRKRCKSSNEMNSVNDVSALLSKRKRYKHSKQDTTSPSEVPDSSFSSGIRSSEASAVSPELTEKYSAERLYNANSHSVASKQSYRSRNVEKVPNFSTKVPLLPLLNEPEKGHIQHQHKWHSKTETTSTPTVSKISLKEPKVKHLAVSKLAQKSMGAKCQSDSALSSSLSPDNSNPSSAVTQSHTRVSHEDRKSFSKLSSPIREDSSVVLHAGDQLEITGDVNLRDFENQRAVTARLITNDQDSGLDPTIMTNMPDMFKNCIEPRVKIQFVQKQFACKVCGFSVDATNENFSDDDEKNPLALLETHVMEHSLKELYATKL